jgi:hypothetical protein
MQIRNEKEVNIKRIKIIMNQIKKLIRGGCFSGSRKRVKSGQSVAKETTRILKFMREQIIKTFAFIIALIFILCKYNGANDKVRCM